MENNTVIPKLPSTANATRWPKYGRITATEVIDGVEHRIILEQDAKGRYREVLVLPCNETDAHLVAAPNGCG